MKSVKKASVTVRNLSLSYGTVKVRDDISLHIEPGEFFALIGPSGSGKSSLLRLIAGFLAHQSGELQIDGVDVRTQPPHLRKVGMVFQNYALWPHLSVRENVAFGLHEQRLSRRDIALKVDVALDMVDLFRFQIERRLGAKLQTVRQHDPAIIATLSQLRTVWSLP